MNNDLPIPNDQLIMHIHTNMAFRVEGRVDEVNKEIGNLKERLARLEENKTSGLVERVAKLEQWKEGKLLKWNAIIIIVSSLSGGLAGAALTFWLGR